MMSPFLTVILASVLFVFSPVGACATEASPPPFVTESIGGRFAINAEDADIRDVIESLAKAAHTHVSIAAGATGRVTLRLDGATLEEALRKIAGNAALVHEKLPDEGGWRIVGALVAATEHGGSHPPSDGPTPAASGQTSAEAVPPNTKTLLIYGDASAEDPAQSSGKAPTSAPRPAWKKGELLVRFKPDAPADARARLHKEIGAALLKTLAQSRIDRVKLPAGLDEDEAARHYRASQIVESAGKNHLRYPQATPGDPFFSSQWNMKKIGAEALWDIAQGSRDVVVAVIDSGVDLAHPDLQDNIWINETEKNGAAGVDDDANGYIDDIYGWDFAGYSGLGDNDPMDAYGHGTHVSGILGAVGNNGIGVAGLNWRVRIMPLKVMEDSSEEFTEDAIIEAIDYAIANGARIVNASFGGTAYSDYEYAAFARLRGAGILVSTAAGNYSNNMDIGNKLYPACYALDNILSVANANSLDALSASSNYGKTTVDVAAPGDSIYSTALLSGTTASVRSVDASPAVEYSALGMEYAALTAAEGIAGALCDCGMGYSGYTCDSEAIDQIPDAVSGNIALVQRGNCDGEAFYFSQKVANAMAKGAAGVIIYNNLDDDPYDDDNFDTDGGTLGAPGSWVPVVSISKSAGEALLDLLDQAPLRVALINKPTVNPYKYMSGTSMATPHVAGLAALLYGQCPSVGYANVKAAIINASDKLPDLADKTASGGRINAFSALTSLFPPGDLSADCRIDLADAIIALRILSGMQTSLVCPLSSCRHHDVNDNGQVGLEEVIIILQTLIDDIR